MVVAMLAARCRKARREREKMQMQIAALGARRFYSWRRCPWRLCQAIGMRELDPRRGGGWRDVGWKKSGKRFSHRGGARIGWRRHRAGQAMGEAE